MRFYDEVSIEQLKIHFVFVSIAVYSQLRKMYPKVKSTT